MNKGFEFWSTKNFFPFIAAYWALFFLFDSAGTLLSVLTKNPFYYLIVGIIPYPIIKIYRILHNPYHRIEESIRQIDPELYNRSLQEETKKMVINIDSSEKVYNRARLIHELNRTGLHSNNLKIALYAKNVRSIDNTAMASLAKWFFTFAGLMFILFLMRS
jgi:hypothetical protein